MCGNPKGHFYHLSNADLKVTFCDIGASIVKLETRDRAGRFVDVVLGYPLPDDYRRFGAYLGSTIGRVANRIKQGQFNLNGKSYQLDINNGPNHLHGGNQALNIKYFQTMMEDEQITFTTMMMDQESGYPGNVEVTVRYQLEGKALRIDLMAISDQDTICNLTNHAYFNLNGAHSGDILGHYLQVDADHYVPIDETGIPLGELQDVMDTPFDVRQPRLIEEMLGHEHQQLHRGNGLDHGFILKPHGKAVLYSPLSGIKLTLTTTQPGLQIYSGNYLEGSLAKHGTYQNHAGIALEAQVPADAINQPQLGNIILKAGKVYHHSIKYELMTMED